MRFLATPEIARAGADAGEDAGVGFASGAFGSPVAGDGVDGNGDAGAAGAEGGAGSAKAAKALGDRVPSAIMAKAVAAVTGIQSVRSCAQACDGLIIVPPLFSCASAITRRPAQHSGACELPYTPLHSAPVLL